MGWQLAKLQRRAALRKASVKDDPRGILVGLPSKIRIAANEYTLKVVADRHMPFDNGLFYGDRGEIWINRGHIRKNGPAQVVNTVVHEIIHAIHCLFGVKDGDLEEHATEQTTNGLLQVLADNPTLLQWLSRVISEYQAPADSDSSHATSP